MIFLKIKFNYYVFFFYLTFLKKPHKYFKKKKFLAPEVKLDFVDTGTAIRMTTSMFLANENLWEISNCKFAYGHGN